MARTPTLVYLGLDAVDRNLVRSLCAAGRMPAVASLLDRSIQAPVINATGLYVSSLWRTVATGRHPGVHGRHSWCQAVPGTYRLDKHDLRRETGDLFWNDLQRRGRDVSTLDMPLTGVVPTSGSRGIQLLGIDNHDWRGDPMAEPAGSVPAECDDRVLPDCDTFAAQGRHAELMDDLLAIIATKGDAIEGLLDDGPEALLTVFGAGHCGGHQFWHLHDAEHPRHEPAWAAANGGDPVVRIYEALDGQVGRVLERSADATVVLHLSHGMGPHYDGSHLLPAIIARLDDALLGGHRRVLGVADRGLRAVRYHGRRALRRAGIDPLPHTVRWLDASLRLSAVPNNACNGAVRANVRGRDPRGVIEPDELPRVLDRVAEALRGLVHADTGEPVVDDVIVRSERYPGPRSEQLPDLFVIWRRDRPVDAVKAPWLDPLSLPYRGQRTGDHRLRSLIAVRPPGLAASRTVDPIGIIDLAPTLAAALGEALPDADGTPALALLGR